MFEFRIQQTPLAVQEACPVCVRHWEEQGHSISAQKLVLCTPHRRHIEKLLRDPNTSRQEITTWLNLIRKTTGMDRNATR